ncbi:recombinase family protein [Streptomonospora salina]
MTHRPVGNPIRKPGSEPTDFAFLGRVSTEDQQDPESSRQWQRSRATALIQNHGGHIVEEFFDIDRSRSVPPQRRPQASRLLDLLANPNRGFDAVVVGEPQRAFYGNQFAMTFPMFEHYSVQLWVPEIGGAIDPANEAHELIMSMYGGISKGERTRIKTRVRAAMTSQAQMEGRWLGGRPPYGYMLEDVGPHPNPAKASDGKRMHRLVPDPQTEWVVRLIFAHFLNGWSIGQLAEHLTREGIPSPSAYDRKRNRHRSGVAWAKGAIRVILTNPRYTGRQVWAKQRKDEELIDVHDVQLGHTTKQRWNDKDEWVWSERIMHESLIPQEAFDQVQQILAARGTGPTSHKPHRRRYPYVLRTLLFCGVCDRRMQGQWTNNAPYYRCRFPQEYALANKIEHPRNVYLREDLVVPQLDAWLAREFAPDRIDETIAAMAANQGHDEYAAQEQRIRMEIEECERRLRQYRDALDGGAAASAVIEWITEAENQRQAAQAKLKRLQAPSDRLDEATITQMVHELGDIVRVLEGADSDDKAELYKQLGLRATYNPGEETVQAEVVLSPDLIGDSKVSEGGLEPPCPMRALAPQASASTYSATRTYRPARRALAGLTIAKVWGRSDIVSGFGGSMEGSGPKSAVKRRRSASWWRLVTG